MTVNVSSRAARVTLLALALASAATIAAPPAPRASRLHTNHDGAVDRTEAAAQPRLAEHFDRIDRNHDGRITADERPQGMHGMHERHGGPDARLARLDADGDGRLSRAEIGQHDPLAERFAEIDANKDGYLVRAEVRAWHERMRPQREAEREKRAADFFTKADLDHDGRLSKVEASEAMPRMAQGFAWMDDNRDGFLSREELHPRRR